jgi:hypothetical protein
LFRNLIAAACGAVLCALAPSPVFASVTNVIDVAKLAAAANIDAGDVLVDGWRLKGLETYSSDCLKFNTLNDTLISVEFPRPVVGIIFSVRCTSTSPTRSLNVFSGEDGVFLGALSPVAVKDSFEKQLVLVPEETGVRKFSIRLEGTGNTGVWGVSEISVITASPVEAPASLAVLRALSSRAAFSWVNSFSAVSNEIVIARVEADAPENEEIFSCDFSQFSAAGNTSDFSSRLPELYEGLFGVRIYAPENSSGLCQISKGDMHGVLGIDAVDDYSGVSFHIRLKRYPGDFSKTHLRWTDGSVTNLVKTIELADDFAEEIVDVSSLPYGAKLLIVEDSAKSGRRVIVDSLSFVRKVRAAEISRETKVVSFSGGAHRVSSVQLGFSPLAPSSRYRVSVRAFNAEGESSSASEAEFFTAKTKPTVVILR